MIDLEQRGKKITRSQCHSSFQDRHAAPGRGRFWNALMELKRQDSEVSRALRNASFRSERSHEQPVWEAHVMKRKVRVSTFGGTLRQYCTRLPGPFDRAVYRTIHCQRSIVEHIVPPKSHKRYCHPTMSRRSTWVVEPRIVLCSAYTNTIFDRDVSNPHCLGVPSR